MLRCMSPRPARETTRHEPRSGQGSRPRRRTGSNRTTELSDRAVGLSRERIVGATLEVLEEVGVAGLNMRLLSARLGVTLGATYRHITSKDALLGLAAGEVLARTRVTTPDNEDWRTRLRELAVDYILQMERYPGLANYAIHQAAQLPTSQLILPIRHFLTEAGIPEAATRAPLETLFCYITGVLVLAADSDAPGQWANPTDVRAGLDIILAGVGDAAALPESGCSAG